MFSEAEIVSKAWLTAEVVNLVLMHEQRQVDKIYLIGSYANGTANSRSDLDFLIQLKGGSRVGMFYVTLDQVQEMQSKLGTRIHVVFGTQEAAERLHQKHKHEVRNYKYREISQGRIYADTHSPRVTQ